MIVTAITMQTIKAKRDPSEMMSPLSAMGREKMMSSVITICNRERRDDVIPIMMQTIKAKQDPSDMISAMQWGEKR